MTFQCCYIFPCFCPVHILVCCSARNKVNVSLSTRIFHEFMNQVHGSGSTVVVDTTKIIYLKVIRNCWLSITFCFCCNLSFPSKIHFSILFNTGTSIFLVLLPPVGYELNVAYEFHLSRSETLEPNVDI